MYDRFGLKKQAIVIISNLCSEDRSWPSLLSSRFRYRRHQRMPPCRSRREVCRRKRQLRVTDCRQVGDSLSGQTIRLPAENIRCLLVQGRTWQRRIRLLGRSAPCSCLYLWHLHGHIDGDRNSNCVNP